MKLQRAALGIDPLDLCKTNVRCGEDRPHELGVALERLFEWADVTEAQNDDLTRLLEVYAGHIDFAGRITLARRAARRGVNPAHAQAPARLYRSISPGRDRAFRAPGNVRCAPRAR